MECYSAPEAERAVIASLLLDPQKVFKILEQHGFKPAWLKTPLCHYAYLTVSHLIKTGRPVDTATVATNLSQEYRENPAAHGNEQIDFEGWMATTVTPAHIEGYLQIVRDRAERNAAATSASALREKLKDFDRDVRDIVAETRHELTELVPVRIEATSNMDAFAAAELDAEQAAFCGSIGIPSSVPELQELMMGWPMGKLSLLGGRPKQGKSTLLNCDTTFSALSGIPSAVASIEMSRKEWLVNSACWHAKVNSERFRAGVLTREEKARYAKAKDLLLAAPLYVDDGPQTIGSLCAFIRDMAIEKKCKIIGIDYLQLISSSRGASKITRNEEVGSWSNALAGLAKQLPETALVLISQLSRAGMVERNPRPQLHHLRDSGSLEQDAYMVVFVYQDPAAGAKTVPDDAPTIIEVAARRGGKTGEVNLLFKKSLSRFMPANGAAQ